MTTLLARSKMACMCKRAHNTQAHGHARELPWNALVPVLRTPGGPGKGEQGER